MFTRGSVTYEFPNSSKVQKGRLKGRGGEVCRCYLTTLDGDSSQRSAGVFCLPVSECTHAAVELRLENSLAQIIYLFTRCCCFSLDWIVNTTLWLSARKDIDKQKGGIHMRGASFLTGSQISEEGLLLRLLLLKFRVKLKGLQFSEVICKNVPATTTLTRIKRSSVCEEPDVWKRKRQHTEGWGWSNEFVRKDSGERDMFFWQLNNNPLSHDYYDVRQQ